MQTDICTQCGLRYVVKPFKAYDEDVCWICWLKNHKSYKAAMREIREPDCLSKRINNINKWRNGWFNWSTYMFNRIDCKSVKTGWSFVGNMLDALLLGAVLNLSSLNKRPKCPNHLENYTNEDIDNGIWPKNKSEEDILKQHGYSDWQIKTFFNYYPRLKEK